MLRDRIFWVLVVSFVALVGLLLTDTQPFKEYLFREEWLSYGCDKVTDNPPKECQKLVDQVLGGLYK